MNVTSIAHVCLHTADLEATRKFYCDLLGMSVQFWFTKNGRRIGFYLNAGNGTFLEAFLKAEVPEYQKIPNTLAHFCLETDDLAALHQRLVEAGCHPTALKTDSCDQTWQFWVKDPNGLPLEVQQYTSHSAQMAHEDVEVPWPAK